MSLHRNNVVNGFVLYNTLFEIDARKTHLSDEEWVKVAETGARFIIDSDAHHPSNIGIITGAEEMIKRTGFPVDKIVNLNGQVPKNLRFSEFKKSL